MADVVEFFANIPSYWRTILLAGGLLFFWTLESAVPLFRFRENRWKHGALNILLTLFQMTVGFSFAVLIVKAADFGSTHAFGLVHVVEMPLWLQIVIGLLVLDLVGAYFIHWLQHQVKWMWRFHLVHHTDRQVDVTTGLRHHPGETVFRSLATVLAVLIAGVPVGVVFLYQTLSIFFAHLTHANIQLPAILDRPLSYVFVTPTFHKVHHHYVQPQTDSNYGNIFSIWDRLFGTAREIDPDALVYGIDTHMKKEEYARLSNLLLMPFQRYRAPTGAKFADDQADSDDRS